MHAYSARPMQTTPYIITIIIEVPQRFPLLFPNAPQMSSRSQNLSSLSDSDRRVSASQVSPCTQRVETQVNVGGSEDTVTVTNQQSTESNLSPIGIPIKVINPSKKRESKTYMLNIPIDHIHNLKSLCEHILELLGKNVVSFDLQFDVGYFSSTHKICFIDGDDIKTELKRLSKAGKTLWCDGKSTRPSMASVVCVDSDSDDEPPSKKSKKKPSALESKTLRVDALANELKEKHGNKFNKIQYKLWTEALDVGRHKSKEEPLHGPIWGDKKT